MRTYENDDVVLTDNGEFMTYEEAKRYSEVIFRDATLKESNEFYKERIALEKMFREQEMTSYYHTINE